MPVLMPKKIKGKTFAAGERAFVQRIRGAGIAKGTIARFSLGEPGRRQEPIKEMYYKFKIAHTLFPDNFIQVKAAWRTGPIAYGDVLLSHEKDLDLPSRRLRWRAREAINSPPGSEQWKRFENSPSFKKHRARVKKYAYPLASKMQLVGINVNKSPLNIWFDRKGNPIFFDIFFINPFTLLSHSKGQELQELKGLVERLDPRHTARKV